MIAIGMMGAWDTLNNLGGCYRNCTFWMCYSVCVSFGILESLGGRKGRLYT